MRQRVASLMIFRVGKNEIKSNLRAHGKVVSGRTLRSLRSETTNTPTTEKPKYIKLEFEEKVSPEEVGVKFLVKNACPLNGACTG